MRKLLATEEEENAKIAKEVADMKAEFELLKE